MNKKNISIKKKINKLTYNQKFEIYNILLRNNSKFSENKNGIFFNLKYIDKSTLKLIETFLDYSEDINSNETKLDNNTNNTDNLQNLENEYSNYTNENTSNNNQQIQTSIHSEKITSNTHTDDDYVLYDINNEKYKEEMKKNIKLDIIQLSNQDNSNIKNIEINTINKMSINDTNEELGGEIQDNEEADEYIQEDGIQEDEDIEEEEEEEEDKNVILIEEELQDDDIDDIDNIDDEFFEDSNKKKFIFKNYINKLNLQSKEILPKSTSSHNINKPNYSKYNQALNSHSLSGSTYNIFNICKNISKYNQFSDYNINTDSELILE